MLKLRYADYEGNWQGFQLQKGFWYGTDTETGRDIATSGFECNGYVKIYELHNGNWKPDWYNIEEEEFCIENVPDIPDGGELCFADWLEQEIGIMFEEYDENYSDDELEKEFLSYRYDGLPMFVINNL